MCELYEMVGVYFVPLSVSLNKTFLSFLVLYLTNAHICFLILIEKEIN